MSVANCVIVCTYEMGPGPGLEAEPEPAPGPGAEALLVEEKAADAAADESEGEGADWDEEAGGCASRRRRRSANTSSSSAKSSTSPMGTAGADGGGTIAHEAEPEPPPASGDESQTPVSLYSSWRNSSTDMTIASTYACSSCIRTVLATCEDIKANANTQMITRMSNKWKGADRIGVDVLQSANVAVHVQVVIAAPEEQCRLIELHAHDARDKEYCGNVLVLCIQHVHLLNQNILYAAIFCAVNCALLNSCYVPLVNRIDQTERV